ncbi:MAG: hypothetical protein IKM20_02560 [Erysipelotrichales bacterium]|nr:hypothetical protein [Erysipelotrichales bacterium]
MKQLKYLLLACLLLSACTKNNVDENNQQATTPPVVQTEPVVTTTVVTTTPKVTTTTTQAQPTLKLPNGDIHFSDILLENITNIVLEIENMNIELNSKEREEFLNHIIDIPLYSDFKEENYIIGAYMATLILVDENSNKCTYVEGGSDTIEVRCNREKSKLYGYYPKDRDYDGFKIYLTKYANGILESYRIGLEESQYIDYLQILELETENYTVSSQLGDTTFTYTYDNLINSFKFNPKDQGLKIYENDTYYEELPNNKGEHLIVLKKDNISYQLSYIVE